MKNVGVIGAFIGDLGFCQCRKVVATYTYARERWSEDGSQVSYVRMSGMYGIGIVK